MREFCSVVILLLAAAGAQAQSLEERRDEKLKLPFLTKAQWLTDYDKAREASKQSGKVIFAYFTRSYSK